MSGQTSKKLISVKTLNRIKFQVGYMVEMINCGRYNEAQTALEKFNRLLDSNIAGKGGQ